MENNKNYLGAGLIALAMLVFWIFIFPAYSSIGSLKQSLGDKKALYISRQDIINKIKKINDDYQKNSADVKKISAIITANKSVPEIISAIQTMSARNGIQLTKLSASEPSDTSNNQSYKTLNINIESKGNYNSLYSLLNDIENNIRIIDINKMDISITQDKNSLNMTINASAYYLN